MSSSKRIAVVIALSLLSSMVAGCASHIYNLYPGTPLADKEVGTLETATGDQLWITVDAVDGKSLDNSSDHPPVKVRLLPGSHSVVFTVWSKLFDHVYSRRGTTELTVSAGSRYGFLPLLGPTGDRNGWIIGNDARIVETSRRSSDTPGTVPSTPN